MMKHRAVFTIDGKISAILETKTSRQLAINVRNHIVQLTMENEFNFKVEVSEIVPHNDEIWKNIL